MPLFALRKSNAMELLHRFHTIVDIRFHTADLCGHQNHHEVEIYGAITGVSHLLSMVRV